jgi:hypothetical protein
VLQQKLAHSRSICVLMGAALLVLLAAQGCRRTVEADVFSPPLGQYFPAADGKFRTYTVQDSTYATATWRVRNYVRRETTNGTLPDAQNRPMSRLVLDTARTLTGAFTTEQLWLQYNDGVSAERVEGSTRYVVLNYPIGRGRRWNGNLYNNRAVELPVTDTMQYSYTRTDTTFTVGGVRYTNCLFVRQRFTQRRDFEVNTFEVYAPGVGRILRVDRFLQYILNSDGSRTLNTNSYVERAALAAQNYTN